MERVIIEITGNGKYSNFRFQIKHVYPDHVGNLIDKLMLIDGIKSVVVTEDTTPMDE